MPTITDDAIVIRLSEFSETSQVVAVFTARSGLVRLMAKGTRRSTKKKPAVGIDLLERGDVSFIPARAAGLATLTEWVQRDPHLGLRRSLRTLYPATYAAEIVGALTGESDPHPGLFEALAGLLSELAQRDHAATAPPDAMAALVRFQAALLRSVGLSPHMRTCVGCGRPRSARGPLYFSSGGGGIVCPACRARFSEHVQVPAAIVSSGFAAAHPGAWFELLDYHLSHLAGRRFETAGPLRALGPAADGRPGPAATKT